MPLLIIKTSHPLSEDRKEELLNAATEVLVETGKKKSHAMVLLEKVDAAMAGDICHVAFAEFKSMVAQTHAQNNELSEKLCALFDTVLGIPSDKVYINVTQVPESTWGWQGGIVVWDNPQQKWIVK